MKSTPNYQYHNRRQEPPCTHVESRSLLPQVFGACFLIVHAHRHKFVNKFLSGDKIRKRTKHPEAGRGSVREKRHSVRDLLATAWVPKSWALTKRPRGKRLAARLPQRANVAQDAMRIQKPLLRRSLSFVDATLTPVQILADFAGGARGPPQFLPFSAADSASMRKRGRVRHHHSSAS
jgi:hypothetical protein